MSIDAEQYELMSRMALALESIAGSLLSIAHKGLPQAENQGRPLDIIHGLDDLMSPDQPAPAVIVKENEIDSFTKLNEVVADTLDAAGLAREAEALLNAAATPDVKGTVEIGEGETAKPVLNKINLFHQDRHDIADLVECYPNDPIIQEYIRKRDLPTQPVYATNVLAAAIGLVYKHLPADLYGTVSATAAINQFIQQHSEDV